MTIGSEARPVRVAVVGAGPSGFFTAGALFKQKDSHFTVDLFDRLPAPFGLVRYGVAPDHPEIKRVTGVYGKTAAKPGFRFFGNVTYGTDISLDDLKAHYDLIFFTVGAQSDRRLGIEGEDLPGSYSATEFVAWYNGHPDFAERTFDLSHSTAVVVGAGNVAMDVARILAKTTDELGTTDIADHALTALADSKITDIYVLARRGPAQAKFTTPEIKEFGELSDAEPIVDSAVLELDADCQAEVEASKVKTRNMRVLNEYAERDTRAAAKRVHFRFLVSPAELQGDGKVERVVCTVNKLEKTDSGYLNAVQTEEQFDIEAGLILRSVGYKGVPLADLPYEDRKGTIPNTDGRVIADDGTPIPRLYVAGWVKRGPSGIIGTNKSCAVKTVKSALEDLPTLEVRELPPLDAVEALLRSRNVDFVTFDDWLEIDKAEIAAGEAAGRTRVKVVSIEDMLAHRSQGTAE